VRRSAGRDTRAAVLFLGPLFLFLGLFILLPVVGTIATSLYRDISFVDREFILFDNYLRLLGDDSFWRSVRFTLFFIVCSVPLELAIGLGLALFLNQPMPGRWFFRAAILIPWAIPAAISARAWQLIYNFHYGLANYLIVVSGLSESPVNWLGSSLGAFIALVAADAWKTAPFVAIIFLAGLQAIPDELHEQGRIDRASFFQRFRNITFPLLRPVLVVALLFRTIDGLRVFDLIYVLTGGGPAGSTNSLSLLGYRYFLAGDFGHGAAVSVALFVISLVLSIAYARMARFGGISY